MNTSRITSIHHQGYYEDTVKTIFAASDWLHNRKSMPTIKTEFKIVKVDYLDFIADGVQIVMYK